VDLQKPAATNRPTTTTSTTTSTTNSTTTSTNDTHSPTSAHTILLAEDSETTISIISDYLMSKGFHIIVAMDGQQAVEYAIRYQPDVILMDVQMPVMDGLAAIEQLRDHPRTAHTPIIALTALAMVGDRERCLKAGADDYLSKPVRLKELTKIIQSMIGS
jgi:CheY-like chemotaxis protein